MTRAERETIIILNLGDMDEGYFTVETTELATYKRLRRVVGTQLKLTTTKDRRSGKIITWRCQVPTSFWKGLGIKRTRILTPEARANAVLQGRALASKRKATA